MEKDHQIDEILRDIEEKKTADDIVSENIGSDPAVDVLVEDARKKRKEQIEGFSLDLDVDSIVADVPPLADDGEPRVTAADSAPKEESTPTPTE